MAACPTLKKSIEDLADIMQVLLYYISLEHKHPSTWEIPKVKLFHSKSKITNKIELCLRKFLAFEYKQNRLDFFLEKQPCFGMIGWLIRTYTSPPRRRTAGTPKTLRRPKTLKAGSRLRPMSEWPICSLRSFKSKPQAPYSLLC